ncbi:MAG: hypothetical protein J2P37_32675, partial [Ktedonobacteraceae bacterium]|nr:hypothetical protein [Ktedonobacteraceae bacterium]
MGIYLGQLPPAEIARLKAELAETLIANFCYPRYFDQRTDNLRTRPVDRAKRQEVWLYLSSFDFTAWGRVDLMTVEFQHCIERLLIQFVQRNRSFFGAQGRRRMLDVRMLIGGVAVEVVQGLRGHLAGQKQGFGNPKEVVSWGAAPADGRSDLTWEQISAATMLLQQQLQEWRGEVKPGGRATQQGSGQMPARRRRSQPLGSPSGSLEHDVAQPVSSGAMRATVPSSPGTRAVPPPSTPTAVPSSPAATPVQARMVRESRDPADQ